MIPFSPCTPIWFLTLILVGSAEQGRLSTLVDSSQQVKQLMTPDKVRELMGPPDVSLKAQDFWQLALLGFHSGQWYWGSTVDLAALPRSDAPTPNAFPFHLRLFSYHSNDLVICWDAESRVTEVRRPKLQRPQISIEMFRVWQFIRQVAVLFAGKHANA